MHEEDFYAETQVETVKSLSAQKSSSRTKYKQYLFYNFFLNLSINAVTMLLGN
jgi:hypothetical protein